MMNFNIFIKGKRLWAVTALLLATLPMAAGSPDSWAGYGTVDYSWGSQALESARNYAIAVLIGSIGILYAGCAVLSIVSALQIYIKMNTGEGEIQKSILYLVGGILFMISATWVLPAFFGYELTNHSGGGLLNILHL